MCVSLPTLSYGSLYPVFRFIILSMIVIGIIIVFGNNVEVILGNLSLC
jgi:hypothetical protein